MNARKKGKNTYQASSADAPGSRQIEVGLRPKSLFQVVRLVNSAAYEFGPALAEFLDEAKLMGAKDLELAMALNPSHYTQVRTIRLID